MDELRDSVHNRKLEIRTGANTGTIVLNGKMSTFGGPDDTGVGANEGLALVNSANFGDVEEYFLADQPPGTTGLARRLDPSSFYLACRWDYSRTPRAFLTSIMVTVSNASNGQSKEAKPVDFGPAVSTGRIADLSPGLAEALGLDTNDNCTVTIPLPR